MKKSRKVKNNKALTPYRPWLAFLRQHRQAVVTAALGLAGGGWVAFWLITSGLWYWLFRIVAPAMIIGITVRLVWEAIENDAPRPEPGWMGVEMKGEPLPEGWDQEPEKYSARDVPAHENTPDVLVDEYNPDYIAELVDRMEKEAKGRRKKGPDFEIVEK